MGGRAQSERLVAVNRNSGSRSPGARRTRKLSSRRTSGFRAPCLRPCRPTRPPSASAGSCERAVLIKIRYGLVSLIDQSIVEKRPLLEYYGYGRRRPSAFGQTEPSMKSTVSGSREISASIQLRPHRPRRPSLPHVPPRRRRLRIFSADHRFHFDSRRPAVPGFHYGDRPVALHRCSMAQRIGTQDRARARPQQRQPAAACRRAGGDVDRR